MHHTARLLLASLLLLTACAAGAAERLMVFAGAAAKPPLEAAARAFTRRTGVAVDLVLGGSGYVLAQMKLGRRGDIYLPGSSDYMEKAKREGLVRPETERVLVYLVPAINVQPGNPRGIHRLADLARPGLKVAIANPEGVCVGAYAVEIFEKHLTPAQRAGLRRNLINYTGSCAKTANAIALRQVDAVLGWRVFQHWNPRRIETVPLPAAQVERVGYIPVAVSRFSARPALAQRFIDFLSGPEGQAIFARYHYFPTAEAAFAWLGAEKPVGGEYVVPADWLGR